MMRRAIRSVRAGMVRAAEAWPRSSAVAHTGIDRLGILDMAEWERRWTATAWRQALAGGIEDAALQERVRRRRDRGGRLAKRTSSLNWRRTKGGLCARAEARPETEERD